MRESKEEKSKTPRRHLLAKICSFRYVGEISREMLQSLDIIQVEPKLQHLDIIHCLDPGREN